MYPEKTKVAKQKNATPGQVSLEWLMAQKPFIVPIPGTTKMEPMKDNIGAVNVSLSADNLRYISDAHSKIQIVGARTTKELQKASDVLN